MVQAAMDLRRVKQAWLANTLGVSQNSASRRLRGVTPFDVNELGVLADALGVDIEFFFQAPESLLRKESTGARLCTTQPGHLVGLPSLADPAPARRAQRPLPLLTLVRD